LPLASGDPLKITDPKHGEKHTHTHTRDFFGREKNRNGQEIERVVTSKSRSVDVKITGSFSGYVNQMQY